MGDFLLYDVADLLAAHPVNGVHAPPTGWAAQRGSGTREGVPEPVVEAVRHASGRGEPRPAFRGLLLSRTPLTREIAHASTLLNASAARASARTFGLSEHGRAWMPSTTGRPGKM